MSCIGPEFLQRDPVTCARELIGCTFQWRGVSGKIVETEAYEAIEDEACHTSFRPSARLFIENHEAGTAYVYLNYGVHWLFNILVKGGNRDGFVLLRALEFPVDEKLGKADFRRFKKIGAGPGKLTKLLGINGMDHGNPFLDQLETKIEQGTPSQLVVGSRIGISRAVDRPWRFGDRSSPSLSRPFF